VPAAALIRPLLVAEVLVAELLIARVYICDAFKYADMCHCIHVQAHARENDIYETYIYVYENGVQKNTDVESVLFYTDTQTRTHTHAHTRTHTHAHICVYIHICVYYIYVNFYTHVIYVNICMYLYLLQSHLYMSPAYKPSSPISHMAMRRAIQIYCLRAQIKARRGGSCAARRARISRAEFWDCEVGCSRRILE